MFSTSASIEKTKNGIYAKVCLWVAEHAALSGCHRCWHGFQFCHGLSLQRLASIFQEGLARLQRLEVLAQKITQCRITTKLVHRRDVASHQTKADYEQINFKDTSCLDQ
jgi:hypothetical protein